MKYLNPEIEFITVETEDIILASTTNPGSGTQPGDTEVDEW